MFHHFHGSGFPRSQGSISGDEFDAMIQAIGTNRILPADEWATRAAEGRLCDGDVVLTFDDNLLCQYQVAVPVMRRHGLTGFFFVYTSVLDGYPERLEIYRHFRTVAFNDVDEFYREFFAFLASRPEGKDVQRSVSRFEPDRYLEGYVYLSRADKTFRYVRDRVLGREAYEAAMDAMLAEWDFDIAAESANLWMNAEMLRDLDAEGHVIGLHSHSHPTLIESLDPDAQRAEYETNIDRLTRLCGKRPFTMSHPNSSYSEITLRILGELGVRVGFRANMLKPGLQSLELPRHNHALVFKAMSPEQRAAPRSTGSSEC
jgi:peptidoglycan/xylan/chitin deacetylase (PgdA/CDA1 family)